MNAAALDATNDAGSAARGDQPSLGMRDDTRRELRAWFEALALAVLTTVLCRTFVVQAFVIPSMSMVPTLLAGDHILVGKLRYGIRNPLGGWLVHFAGPRPGEIVVFRGPSDRNVSNGERRDFIKRVLAVGGEVVEVRGTTLLVDGHERSVPGSIFTFGERSRSRADFGPLEVPAGQIFVMGDNRDDSHDSRHWGFVDVDSVEGRAVAIFWSQQPADSAIRWDRIGQSIR